MAAVAAIMAATALLQLGMGRVPWCTCGYISLWSGDIWSSENSQQIADPYTFTHITHGLIFYWTLRYLFKQTSLPHLLVLAVIIESSWEALENSSIIIDRYREATISLDYYGDSVLNSMSDIVAAILGFLFASRFPLKVSLITTAVFELGLAVWIRDSLLLNIIMLIHPFDAIKAWQVGG